MKKWTPEEDNYIKDNYQNMTYAELAEKLNTTKNSVGNRVVKFGLVKRKKFTPKVIKQERTEFNLNPITHTTIFSTCLWHSEGMSVKDLADMFCRPIKVIEGIIADAKADGQYAKYAHKINTHLAPPNNEHYENGFARGKNKKVAY